MIKLKQIFYSIAILLMIIGCKKTAITGESDAFYMKATIDGKSFSTKGELLCLYTKTAGIVVITGTNEDATELFTITSFYELKPGVYQASSANPMSLQFQYVKGDLNYTTMTTGSGSLQIESFDEESKVLKGKFEFKAKELYGTRDIVVSGGEFRCRGIN